MIYKFHRYPNCYPFYLILQLIFSFYNFLNKLASELEPDPWETFQIRNTSALCAVEAVVLFLKKSN